MRVEHEGDRAAWVVGTMVAPTVQGYGLPQPLEYWPYQSLFSSLWYLTIRRPLRLVFAHSSTVQALRGLPCLGSFSVVPCIRHIEGPPPSAPLPAPGWGPTLSFGVLITLCSSLSTVQLQMLACRERDAMLMATPS